jgi:Fe-S cluster assembly protein SufD
MSVAIAPSYLESLLAGQPQLPASPLSWLNRLRAEAVDRVSALTVPTTRDEEWRFTDISPLTKLSFHPRREAVALDAAATEPYALPETQARLVFVDGVYAPALSFNRTQATVNNLAAVAASDGAVIEPHFGRQVDFRKDVFAALNTAFLHDGAVVVVPRDVAALPIHLLFVATQPGAVAYPRCIVIAQAGSSATVIEDFVSLSADAYFTNAVSEFSVADNAQLNHVRVQREHAAAFHIATCGVELAHASRYRSTSIAFGARISRYNLNVRQAAEGVECSIDGLAMITDRQLADTHTTLDHAKPHGSSRQLHKCIVDGSAHAVFNGKILVRPGAQRTDSSQSSRTLLLTPKARVDTKPQLEIFADDVKCAHGATVGQLDADQMFYLRSRGLSDASARNLLTYAFGAEVIDRIPVETLKQRLEQIVLAHTNH